MNGFELNPMWLHNLGYQSYTPQPRMAQKPAIGGGTNTLGNPFSSAMSGMQKGTLQPYINRMTGNANNALYGGLLGYNAMPMLAGNAGGTPQQYQIPQFSIPSALQGGLNFGNRSWMGQNNG